MNFKISEMPVKCILSCNLRKILLIIFWVILTVNTVVLQSIEDPFNATTRLPNTSFPIHYHLHLTTNIHRGDLEFKGNCSILIKVIKTTDQLVLAAKNLKIEKALLIDIKNEEKQEPLNANLFKEFLIINRTDSKNDVIQFQRGIFVRIEIHYSGRINDEQDGFQRITYTNQDGNEVTGAFTLFQPDLARTAFPCYDEPAFKSKHKLRITHGSNLTAISNMPQDGLIIKHSSNDGDMVTTSFLETEIMSIYLLAFVLSDFQYIKSNSVGFPKRIFSYNGIESDAFNIFNHTDWGLETLEKLFNVPYNFQKLDSIIIAIVYEGMENWGLIYYNIGNPIYVDGQWVNDELSDIQVIFHELAHHWFGNLVTLEWWTYIWLNEGFATYYGWILTDQRLTEDRALDRFHVDICIKQLMNSAPTKMTNYTETDLNKIFNSAMYSKAACIIQMFENAFGQKVFRKGVSSYLKANLHSTVTEDDLFDGIQYALLLQNNTIAPKWNYSVHDIMKSWTHNKYFPTISVTRVYEKANSSKIKIRQYSESEQLFWIPLTFATATNPNFENTKADFFMPPTKEIEIDLNSINITLKTNDWLIVNKNAIGYYQIKYDKRNVELLTEALQKNHKIISPLNRALLYANLGDRNNIQANGNFTIHELELISTLENEDDPIVWRTAAQRLLKLPIFYSYRSRQLRSYLKKILKPQYERIHEKAEFSQLSSVEMLMYKQLQALGSELNLDIVINNSKLSESLLENLSEIVINNYEIDKKFQWSKDVCRAVKNVSRSDFIEFIELLRDEIPICLQWRGLLCSQHEESILEFLNIYNETFKDCKCRIYIVTVFLLMDFTDAWKDVWLKINQINKENSECHAYLLHFLEVFFLDIPPENVEKLRESFENYPELTKFYEENNAIRKKVQEDDATIWLKNKLKIIKQERD